MGLEMRILVIEDEQTLAGFIEQSLRADGHSVTVCHDGARGEAAALTGDYALVILDLTLPGKDGLVVLRAIRAQLPELPVIVLTARSAVQQKVEGLDRGANDYVTKPRPASSSSHRRSTCATSSRTSSATFPCSASATSSCTGSTERSRQTPIDSRRSCATSFATPWPTPSPATA